MKKCGEGHHRIKRGNIKARKDEQKNHKSEQEIKEHMPGTDTIADARG